MKIIKSAFSILVLAMLSNAAFSQMDGKEKTVEVGGAAMYPSKNIVQNAVNSKDHMYHAIALVYIFDGNG